MTTRQPTTILFGPAGVWGLATFHTTAFVVVLTTLLHLAGGLSPGLRSLNTLVGLALFGVLWLSTWWTTRKLVRGARWHWSSGETPHPSQPASSTDGGSLLGWLGLGTLWGGVNGVLFVVVTFIVLALAELPAQGPGLLLAVGMVVVPVVVAFVVGAAVGLLFATIDLALVEVAAWIVGQ
jgi:hypothetical protein